MSNPVVTDVTEERFPCDLGVKNMVNDELLIMLGGWYVMIANGMCKPVVLHGVFKTAG